MRRRRCGAVLSFPLACASLLALGTASAVAEPIKVRLKEGASRGFLTLGPPGGTPIAAGELRQKPVGNAVETRLVLQFGDGSLYDETVTFTQNGVFRLEAYRHVQRGPSLPNAAISFDRKSGRYQARTQEKIGDEEKAASGVLDMPADLYNGLTLTLLKNLPAGTTASVKMAAFTPKPRLLAAELTTEGEDKVRLGPNAKTATRYLVKLEVQGLAALVAPVIGKDPPDLRYWLVPGEVPAFVRFEGAMYLNGPVWRLGLATVEW